MTQTRKITFSVPTELYEWLVSEAEKDSRTLSGQVLFIVKEFKAKKDDAT